MPGGCHGGGGLNLTMELYSNMQLGVPPPFCGKAIFR